MIVALVLAAVAAVVLAGALVVVTGRARSVRAELDGARKGLAEAESAAAEARSLAEAAASAHASAESARQEASAEAEALRGKVAELEVAVAEAVGSARTSAEALRACQEALDLAVGAGEQSGLWVLEALRLERRWRESVSTGGTASPFDGSRAPARVALEILAEAVKEESGTSFDLTWEVDGDVAPAAALRLSRGLEEVLAVASAGSDGGHVAVRSLDDEVLVEVVTDPALVLPPELAAALEVLSAGDPVLRFSPPAPPRGT